MSFYTHGTRSGDTTQFVDQSVDAKRLSTDQAHTKQGIKCLARGVESHVAQASLKPTHYVAEGGFYFLVFLPLPPKCWEYRVH